MTLFRNALASLLALAATAGPVLAQVSPPSEGLAFTIGSEGVACEAQGVMMGEGRASLFDRQWAIICPGADQAVGRAVSLAGGREALTQLAGIREGDIRCSTSTSDPETGVESASCSQASTGLSWRRYTQIANGRLYAVDGLAAFDSALRLTLASIALDRIVPGRVDIVSTGSDANMAAARASLGDAESMVGQGYRRNNAGEYADAAEFFQPELLGLADAGQAGFEQLTLLHELLTNRALQFSNLEDPGSAARLFAQARELAGSDPIQTRLSRNYEAIDALNRGAFDDADAILARPVPAVSLADEDLGGSFEIDRRLALWLNAGGDTTLSDSLTQEAGLSTYERAAIIDAQARQLHGTVLRLRGDNAAARSEIVAARSAMLAVRDGRVLTTTRLNAQMLGEIALTLEAEGNYGSAEAHLREAVVLLETRYPDSPSVNGGRARLAAFLARRGRNGEAMALYRELVEATVGERGALVGMENQMRPYFALLADEVDSNPALADDMFLAAQLIERPGAAQTLAQLNKRFEARDGAASDLFRQAIDNDRELTRARMGLAQVRLYSPDSDPSALAVLQERIDRLAQVQLELREELAQYPEYRSVSRNYVTAAEMRATLGQGEGYLKLVRVGPDYFAVYLGQGRSLGWKVSGSAAKVDNLVALLRDSISVTINGVNATYPFDVDSARTLYRAVFDPVADEIGALDHLVFEPDGALLQLPVNLLVADDASVERYWSRVDAGGDEFDFTGVEWLGRDKAVSTALSAASFRDARRAEASEAPLAYLGMGQNAVPQMRPAVARRDIVSSLEADCQVPFEAWSRPIPASELSAAANRFGESNTRLLTGAAFTDTALQGNDAAAQYRILHFATHGLVNAPRPGCPARPALLTSFGDQDSDGLLRFVEIFDLKLDADLVILSACDTAGMATLDATLEAGITSGGGQALDGLVRAFIGAGGRQVIASHWPAPEEYDATQRLMQGLFAAVPGEALGQALLGAQRQMMDDPLVSHPFYWSGFAVIGDGARPLIAAN